MYTQCPDCSTAFRITAEVLKQAAGKVRCGGCGVAFNALDHLSERRPVSAAAAGQGRSSARRSGRSPSLEAAEAPGRISPERGAALMRTLDRLAGSEDVRIEDTGVEWRVLDDAKVADDADDDSGAVRTIEDTGSMRFVIADNDNAASGEMRFDDNTPLPDDFDFDEESEPPPPPPEPVLEVPDVDAAQADLALGDPEEWQDLLGEVQGPPEGVGERRNPSTESAAQRSLAEELAALQADEDDSPSSIDDQFAMQAEAMGIDISGAYRKVVADEPKGEPRDLDDSSIDDDLIAAAFETEKRQRLEREEATTGIVEPEDDDDDSGEIELLAPADDEKDDAVDIELDASDDDDDSVDIELDASDDAEESVDIELEAGDENEDSVDFELEASDEDEDSVDFELDAGDDDDALDISFDAADEDESAHIELVGKDDDTAEADDGKNEADEVEIPPMSEEELTINKMIDEELLAIAVEDEDGFASTIVQIQPIEEIKPREDVVAEAEEVAKEPDEFADNPLVETIIMEGDFIRDEAEERALEEARRKSGDPTLKSARAADMLRRQEDDTPVVQKRPNYRMIAGIVVLALLLVLQVLHFSRDALATNPAIRDVIAPIYRLFGQAVTPTWDIRGWRFEITRGSAAGSGDSLTIYSRIGNKSAEALPYPLISVSLTDRFEETIGSRVLGPSDYLGENADTQALIAPRGTFDAMISIAAPDAQAVGFKLNVCYPHGGDRLRCAVEDFR